MEADNKYRPAVSKPFLLFIAGMVWEGVGIMLLAMACSWLSATPGLSPYRFAAAGILMALPVHHFGFLRIVDKNLKRLLPMQDKRCVFSFITWQSYLIIAVMVTMGALLRHSAIPKPYLAVLYIGIGLALLLSSVRYMRYFYREIRFRSATHGRQSDPD